LFAARLSAPGALMQVPARRDAALGCAAIVAKAGHKPSSDKKRFGQSKGQSPPALFAAECEASLSSGGPWTPNAYSAPMSNFTRHDPSRRDIAILVAAMLRAREVVTARPWSTSQEATTEHWWADVLADPRSRIRRQPRGSYGRDSKRTAQKSHYRLADEPSPVIEVACSKCEWKAAFSRPELVALYGEECPLPTLLNHLAMPGCSKINTHWDRCGVYYVNPIDGREP
jgi:hypothetical protein